MNAAPSSIGISVVTVCYNSVSTIEHAIRSVQAQSHPQIEHVIVDGASNDGTVELLEQHREEFATLISEPDKGVYDAINKGIKASTSAIVGLMHSDDFFADEEVLQRIAAIFEANPEVQGVYGDLQYVDREDENKVIRMWKSQPYVRNLFRKGWMPPHPTLFLRRELFESLGYYRTDLKISGDYELMLRYFHKHRINTQYLPGVLVKMRVGGISNTSLKNRLHANKEDRLAWKLNGLRPGPLTLLRKPLSKLTQFLGNK